MAALVGASNALLREAWASRGELAQLRGDGGKSRDEQGATVAELRAESAKDKSFMLAVVNTLKEQLAEERAERGQVHL